MKVIINLALVEKTDGPLNIKRKLIVQTQKVFHKSNIVKENEEVVNTRPSQLPMIDCVNNFNGKETWNLGKYGYKAEFRELKESDLVGLDDKDTERGKEYIGKKSIIVKFDYNTVFKKVKEELRKKDKED